MSIMVTDGAGLIGSNFVLDRFCVKYRCRAIGRVLEAGQLGETYNVGGWNEKPKVQSGTYREWVEKSYAGRVA